MKTISLFSGCGGMDIGAQQAGAEVIYANDIDSDSVRSLEKHFPSARTLLSDVRELTEFPSADLIIGGYPCQSFSIGGKRDPEKDERTQLYQEFARCVDQVQPKFFVAENVSGLQKLKKGRFLKDQIDLFGSLRNGAYEVFPQILNARDYGIPQTRKRLFIVGVHKDLGSVYRFPNPTHGDPRKKLGNLKPFASHGDAIADLPLWPEGEFYERPHDPEGHWSWYYMSRNRKAPWDAPSYTIVANWRHITLHPGSPTMKLTWSNLADNWKQRWDFSGEYEHLEADPDRPKLNGTSLVKRSEAHALKEDKRIRQLALRV